MYAGIKDVKPLSNYKLLLTFEDGKQNVFDMTSYLDKGIFSELRDEKMFQSVHISFDSIEWANGADLCPETLQNPCL